MCLIVLLILQQTKNEDGSITKLVSQFNLVDLAGSERQSNTKITDGIRIKVISYNKKLLV